MKTEKNNEPKIDRRKENGGHINGGRKPIFEDGEPVMVSFKVNKSTKKALSKIGGYGAYIESLIRKDLNLDELPDDLYPSVFDEV